MKCHYEVLEISLDADDGDIKTAYRKQALKWHPDKNLDDTDLAKEQFQLVQQAYEVLSDRHERAWYDAHRDQILKGPSSEFEDKSLDVFQYFTTTCFKGYGDDENGFYTIYRKVFQQIANEDIEFMDKTEEFCEIPGFGKSDSDYEEVKSFYSYWICYSTKKSYSWLDPYDIREGRNNRRFFKMIEKENKKVQLKAKKDRNEEIRNLVAFVRKRDKRVQVYQKVLEAKTLENRKKNELLSKQKRMEWKQQQNSDHQADWLKFENVQSELEAVEKHLTNEFGEESNSEEEDFNNLYCVACNKMFKTPKAFENHELSRKHKDNVETLKEYMLLEDMKLNKASGVDDYNDFAYSDENLEKTVEELLEEKKQLVLDAVSGEESVGDEDSLPETSRRIKKKKQKHIKRKTLIQKNENLDLPSEDPEGIVSKTNKNKNKGNGTLLFCYATSTTSDEIPLDTGPSEDNLEVKESRDSNNSNEMNKECEQKSKIVANKSEENNSKQQNEEGDVKPKEIVNKRSKTKNKEDIDANGITEHILKELQSDMHKMTRKSRANRTKLSKNNNQEKRDLADPNGIDLNHCCVTCKQDFPSKNKLFDHLKKTGHGVYIPPRVKQSRRKGSAKN